MMSIGCNYEKLKTNLRLAINRLKFLEKKKTELAQKSKKEIAVYLVNGKLERAKIRVEHIIREDYLVEAMEVVEMYCDLLLARFGLIQQMKTLDEGLAEAVSSLIWAAPQLQTDVAELKIISDQLALKYGKPYALAVRENDLHSVNEKLVHKLSVQAPPKNLVEKYLIEIARSHNIPYEPDVEILAEEQANDATANVPLIEFGNDSKPPDPGFVTGHKKDNLIDPGIQCPQPDLPKPFNYPSLSVTSKIAPPIPNVQTSGPHPGPSSSIGFNIDDSAPSNESVFAIPPNAGAIPKPTSQANIPEIFPDLPSNTIPDPSPIVTSNGAPPITNVQHSGPYPGPSSNIGFNVDTPAQSRESVFAIPQNAGSIPKPTSQANIPEFFPDLPSVPNTEPDSGPPNEVDFDDLAKRFEELKKRG